MLPQRGDIFYADTIFNANGIAVNNTVHPILILDNQMGSRYKPTVICATIVQMSKPKLPIHVALETDKYPLASESVIRMDFIQTIDNKRLREKICRLDADSLKKVEAALKMVSCISDAGANT